MGRFFNPDNEAFCRTLNSEIYIDKTGLLDYTNKVINTEQAFICNSRPRRFGKSITANMLTAYYSKGCDSRDLFKNLDICKADSYEKNINQYNVIHLDLQWFINFENHIIDKIQSCVVTELKEVYGDILKGNESLPEAMSLIYNSLKEKFIVIIDEWDVLIREESIDKKIQEEYIAFLRMMFKGTEPSKYIALAYLTGILPIKKQKTQSALNNFDEFTMLDSSILAQYIGFTNQDVKALCQRYDVDYHKVKIWYDGYMLGNYQVYNPKAVVNVMTRRNFVSYWSQTGNYEAIVPLINMDFDGLKTSIVEMISGAEVEIDVNSFQNDTVSFANRDDVLTYLIHLGYLGYNPLNQRAFIPNEEIRQELINATRRKKWNEFHEFQVESDKLLEATLDKDTDEVAKLIEKIHNEYASSISYNNENSLSSVLAIGYLSTMQFYFKPIRELPTGRGFADFVYIPKPEYRADYPALVIELKWNKSAQSIMVP